MERYADLIHQVYLIHVRDEARNILTLLSPFKLGFTVSLLYIFGIICARFALFFLYLRAFPVPWLQFATKFLMVLSTCLIISIILWDIFLCRPVRQLWDLTAGGTCGDPGPPYKAGLILGISTDVIAIILPLPLIWGLHTSRQNKISLTCLFAVGLNTAGIASWRLTTLSIINSKTRAILFFSAVIEIGMVVVCSSVPIIYPLFSRRRQKCTSNPPPGAPKAAGAGRIARVIRTFGSITFRRQSYNHLDSDLNMTFGSRDIDTVASNATRPSGFGIEVVQEWSVVNSPKPDTTYV
ncbi:hypothetical protein F4806DRAFT_443781 [Annulohypoxylon nitens]|nr:hypothetical protein F4806DRAFT_443781 [Annulohypoxylon nitens]